MSSLFFPQGTGLPVGVETKQHAGHQCDHPQGTGLPVGVETGIHRCRPDYDNPQGTGLPVGVETNIVAMKIFHNARKGLAYR